MMSSIVHQGTAPLRITNCKDLENNPRLKLLVKADNIVAYRLGVLKDTPQEFAINLGAWVNLNASNVAKDKEVEITASANQTGLSPQNIYKQEYFTKYTRLGQPTKIYHGVAVFVAAVELADGTIWQQDLRREFLIWDE